MVGFAERQFASERVDPSYLRHWTVRDCKPLPFLAHEAVRVWVPLQHAREQVPQEEYPQAPVSPEHEPHDPEDHEFATQDEPFQEWPELQANPHVEELLVHE